MLKACRECQHKVSDQARICPNCGIPYPAKEQWDGWGFEYKSKRNFVGFLSFIFPLNTGKILFLYQQGGSLPLDSLPAEFLVFPSFLLPW